MIEFVSQLSKLSFRGRRFHVESFIINTFLGSFAPTEREE